MGPLHSAGRRQGTQLPFSSKRVHFWQLMQTATIKHICVFRSRSLCYGPISSKFSIFSTDLHRIPQYEITRKKTERTEGRRDKVKAIRSFVHVARIGEDRGVYRVLVGKLEGKRPLGRPKRRWVDNIRMDLQEVGCGYMDWIGLAQDRDRWRTLVSAVMNLRVP